MSTTFAFHYRDATSWLLSAMDTSRPERWTNALDAARRALAAAYLDAETLVATSLIDAIRRAAPMCGMHGLPAPEPVTIPGHVWTQFLAQESQLDEESPGDVTLSAVVGEIERLISDTD